MTIKIFQNEINDGIGELVKSTASVAYCSETVKADSFKVPVNIADKCFAENKDQIDLYYLESVLVSCSARKTVRATNKYLPSGYILQLGLHSDQYLR